MQQILLLFLPQSPQTIPLNLRWAIPDGFFGQIMPRSSILVYHLVTVDGGVIDSDVRGIVKAILVNLSKKTFTVRLGHRIAQIVLIEKYNVKFEKVSDKSLLSATKRGSSGFESTGSSVIKKKKNLMIGLLNLMIKKFLSYQKVLKVLKVLMQKVVVVAINQN